LVLKFSFRLLDGDALAASAKLADSSSGMDCGPCDLCF